MRRGGHGRLGHLYGHGHAGSYGYGGSWGHGGDRARLARRAARDAYRAARYDHRRERRLRRRGGPPGPPAPLVRMVIVSGAVVLVGSAVGMAVAFVVAQVMLLLVVGLLAFGIHNALRAATSPAADTDTESDHALRYRRERAEEAWRRARSDFAQVRAAYAAHEIDPSEVLRRPALSDVSVPSTARFVDAFAAAQALDTDDFPGEHTATSYVRAAEQARRSWEAATEAADRIRLAGFSPEERRTVERVLKLLTTARDSDSEPERLAAYSRARTELSRLDRAGVIHLPRPARAELDARARGELPGS
ncbi:hypothetical protein WIS52_30360 [Pseudonocardia nematodicida]|uniref:DUF4129 domain-containing protein n=1 Tax=Pseudonocardia nematodicida TaxID=1206997 RepID=A0ABV1KLC6_9PSEU